MHQSKQNLCYKGEVPKGYHVVRCPTYSVWPVWRSFLVDGDPKPGVDLVKKYTKIYPLADVDKPHPSPKFVDMSGKPFSMVGPSNYQFWEMLNQIVPAEPTETVDPTTLGLWASIGIQKGKPFAPDARMKTILTEAATMGDPTARAISYRFRQKQGYFFDNSNWRQAFVGGYKFEWQPGAAVRPVWLIPSNLSIPMAAFATETSGMRCPDARGRGKIDLSKERMRAEGGKISRRRSPRHPWMIR